MARREAPLQINGFSKGLNTEFNPLAMPPDVSIDEVNMEITSDGSRAKRLGFGFEDNYVNRDTGVYTDPSKVLATSTYRWENAGGDPEKTLLVIQIGNFLAVHDLDSSTSVSGDSIYSENFNASCYDITFSYAVVDGLLVVSNGLKQVLIYEYGSGTVTKSTDILLIRDLFGVSYEPYTNQTNLTSRPTTMANAHRYNLRNQTFNSPRYANNTETLVDPIKAFHTSSGSTNFPSNADNLNLYLYADANDGDNRLIERFFSSNMVKSAPSVSEAPKGHFIIDALERGASRENREAELQSEYPTLQYPVVPNSLPVDRTPNGASVVEEYAGRIWYGGFSGQLIGGDPKSPRMSSYVLFSMLVKDKTDIARCYQRADPTSNEDSALVDTDGGFIRIDGAYGINNMVNLKNSLFVFARNGVWRISGGGDTAFSATGYEVDKITNEGCISPNSVVTIGGSIFYWGDRSIFSIARNEFGFWEAGDISSDTIKSYYLSIPEGKKRTCSGFYDSYAENVHWIFSEADASSNKTDELIFNLRFNSFSPMEIPTDSGGLPLVVSIGRSQPYKLQDLTETVTSGGVTVTSSGSNVTISASVRSQESREAIYTVITRYAPTIEYTFGLYRSSNFYDWEDVEYEAYLVSGSVTGGQAKTKKQTPYLDVFFRRTEDGFDNDLNPTNTSSCLVSSRWDWTSNSRTSKWSNPREAYRYNSSFFPTGPSDPFDTGETVITTKNKIRGMGHSVAFRFESVPGKNLHIHGWSFNLQANEE